MKLMRLLDVETRNRHFTVAVSPGRDPGLYTAKYWSAPSRYSRPGLPGEDLSGSVSGADADGLVNLALAQIDGLDGPVLSVVESRLTRPRPQA